jgi:hypothetical protein
VALAPQKEATGAALSGVVEDENSPAPPAAPAAPVVPVSKLFADPPAPAPAWPTETSVSAAPPQAPAGPDIHFVNSKRISLNYEVKDGGATGSTEVELWCTRDGRTWKKMETLPQGRPPCLVDVDDEDLYGFTLVVHQAGTPGKAPREGDRPQVWVEVDVTKPTVWLLGVEAGKGPEGRQAAIQWKAADKNSSSRPITAQTPQPLGEEPVQPTAAILKVEGTSR